MMRDDPGELLCDLAAPLEQVVIDLDTEPETLRQAEEPRETQFRIGRDRPLAQDDLVDPPRRQADQARQIFRLIDMPADVVITENEVRVRVNRRAHLPIVLASGLFDNPVAVPWWNGLPLRLVE
jgi:hypothetical protein